MRYFTKELWARMNAVDKTSRMQAETEWNANGAIYQQQYVEIMKLLSSEFVDNFTARNGLHDYTILCISTTKQGREYICELQVTNGSEKVMITMFGLRVLQISIDSFQHCIQGKLTWGYSEFDTTPEGRIRLSVLCDIQNEMQFEFQAISLVKQ